MLAVLVALLHVCKDFSQELLQIVLDWFLAQLLRKAPGETVAPDPVVSELQTLLIFQYNLKE